MTLGIRPVGQAPVDDTCRLSLSPLYGLRDLRMVSEALAVPLAELLRLSQSVNNYRSFDAITGGKLRLVTAPRQRLKAVQREIADSLNRIGHPDYLHSGARGRSNVTHAAGHLGGTWLCKIDLQTFYLQVRSACVRQFFSDLMRCSTGVACLLTRLCTIDSRLPIGSKVSQQLAFLVAKPMFDELAGLANAELLHFSVYVDDLCFSGEQATPSFLWRVKQVIHKHGYRYHHAKCYGPGQPRIVTGTLLTSRRMTLRGRDALRIQQDLAAVNCSAQDEKALVALQGRLAAAKSVDGCYLDSLRTVQAHLRALRLSHTSTRHTP